MDGFWELSHLEVRGVGLYYSSALLDQSWSQGCPPAGGHACRQRSLGLMEGVSSCLTAPVLVHSSCCCIPYLHRVVLGTASPRLGFISFLSNYKRKVGGMRLSPFRLLWQNPIDGALQTTEIDFSQTWRLEVQAQASSRSSVW